MSLPRTAPRRRGAPAILAGLAVLAAAVLVPLLAPTAGSARADRARLASAPGPVGIHKIRHVVIIFQENRSFDSYFGTFPGATGIPMRHGRPTVCVPNPAKGGCERPYVDHADLNGGGPHDAIDSTADVAGGAMNGFLAQAEKASRACADPTDPACTESVVPDVMGYHVGSDIPNYWAWAKAFVLQDHLFSSVHSWSLPSHLFLVSGWSATCSRPGVASSCSGALDPKDRTPSSPTPFAWTDLTYLLHRHHVSWAWYLDHGAAPEDSSSLGPTNRLLAGFAGGVPKIWNVLPGFTDVHTDHQLGDVRTDAAFFHAAATGTLPAVSWLLPDGADSEHPPALVSTGESYVTRRVDAVMRSPDWSSTAVFLTWDDWGGFYDNVVPPKASALGYGIRVPGLVISPYAKKGVVDHQTLSFGAYLAFIEDDFLGGARLDPRTDGRPDPRPVVVEKAPGLGNLERDFAFSKPPRPPLVLAPCPHTTLTGVPRPAPNCHLP